MLERILQRRMQKIRDSGKPGRAVVRIRGVTDDVAAAFVRLLYAGRYYTYLPLCVCLSFSLLLLFTKSC